jgi:hypothetical protein
LHLQLLRGKEPPKKVPVEVRFPLSRSQDYSYSDKFHLV